MPKDKWDWSKFTDRILAGIPAMIALLLFIDPTSRAAQWIPGWVRGMSFEHAQNLVIIILAIAVYIGLSRLRSLRDSVSRITPNHQELTPVFLVVSRGVDGIVSVNLGAREIDFGSGAYEYYERQNETDRQKILRQIRRNLRKSQWNKDDLEMLIDEKRRAQIQMDKFLASSYEIKKKIDAERDRRDEALRKQEADEAKNPFASILRPALFPDFRYTDLEVSVSMWQREVYEFLQRELKGYAEEFRRDITSPTEFTGPLQSLRYIVETFEDRLLSIKRRIPS